MHRYKKCLPFLTVVQKSILRKSQVFGNPVWWFWYPLRTCGADVLYPLRDRKINRISAGYSSIRGNVATTTKNKFSYVSSY